VLKIVEVNKPTAALLRNTNAGKTKTRSLAHDLVRLLTSNSYINCPTRGMRAVSTSGRHGAIVLRATKR
jgi:hypothetical protein